MRGRHVLEPGTIKLISCEDSLRQVLFDIHWQIYKALGKDRQTLAFSVAVDGIVYGVTATRTPAGITCTMIAFFNNARSGISWPPMQYVLERPYMLNDIPAAFNFADFSKEVISVLDPHPLSAPRRRYESVYGPDLEGPADLEAVLAEAKKLAADVQEKGPAPAETIGVGTTPARERRPVYIPALQHPTESVAEARRQIRARIHTAFSTPSVKEKKTVIIDDYWAIKAIDLLYEQRLEFRARDPRVPFRRHRLATGWHVLYVTATNEGLWIYAGPEGFQHQNRIFIPDQLQTCHVKIPLNPPWKLIADMIGVDLKK